MNKPLFGICLCCHNDLLYLKIFIDGIQKNTSVPYEICIYDNGSSDSTIGWLKSKEKQINNLRIRLGNENLGISAGNYAVEMSDAKYVFNFCPDMYPLPNYDIEVIKLLEEDNRISVSSNWIVPPGAMVGYQQFNAGEDCQGFNREKLLNYYQKSIILSKAKNKINCTHPIAISRKLWDSVKGLDLNYKTSYAAEWDFHRKLYEVGIKSIQAGNSYVYHFVSKSFEQFPEAKRNADCQFGLRLFREKWGEDGATFLRKVGIGNIYDG